MGFAAAAAAALALVGGGDAARAPGGAHAGQAPVGVRTRTPRPPLPPLPPLPLLGPVPSPMIRREGASGPLGVPEVSSVEG